MSEQYPEIALVEEAAKQATFLAKEILKERAIVIVMVGTDDSRWSFHHVAALGTHTGIRGVLEQCSELVKEHLPGSRRMSIESSSGSSESFGRGGAYKSAAGISIPVGYGGSSAPARAVEGVSEGGRAGAGGGVGYAGSGGAAGGGPAGGGGSTDAVGGGGGGGGRGSGTPPPFGPGGGGGGADPERSATGDNGRGTGRGSGAAPRELLVQITVEPGAPALADTCEGRIHDKSMAFERYRGALARGPFMGYAIESDPIPGVPLLRVGGRNAAIDPATLRVVNAQRRPLTQERLRELRAQVPDNLSREELRSLLDMALRSVSEEALHKLMGPMLATGHFLGTDSVSEAESREAMALVVKDLSSAAAEAYDLNRALK